MATSIPLLRVFDPLRLRVASWRATASRSPRALIRLATEMVAADRGELALAAAQRGLSLFPYSEDLRRLAGSEVCRSALRRGSRFSGSGPLGAYETAVAEHLVAGDYRAAGEIAREALSRRPRDVRAKVLLAEALSAAFREERRAAEGREALAAWRCALATDDKSIEARLGLAELALAIGATSQAGFHALIAMQQAPQSLEAKRLYARAKRLPIERRSEDDLLWELERDDEARVRAHCEPKDQGYLREVERGLRKLSLQEGVRTVAIRHRGLQRLAEHGATRGLEDRWELGLLALAETLRREGSKLVKRLEIGRLLETEIETDQGKAIAIAAGGSVLLLTMESGNTPAATLEEARDQLAAWTATWTEDLEWSRPQGARGSRAFIRKAPLRHQIA